MATSTSLTLLSLQPSPRRTSAFAIQFLRSILTNCVH
jgi:hypothetical protein